MLSKLWETGKGGEVWCTAVYRVAESDKTYQLNTTNVFDGVGANHV